MDPLRSITETMWKTSGFAVFLGLVVLEGSEGSEGLRFFGADWVDMMKQKIDQGSVKVVIIGSDND